MTTTQDAQINPSIDLVSPQLTVRAVLTGMVLGAILSACNIYTGLKIGWGLNMSVTAALVGYGLWNGLHRATGGRVRHFGILENNINQTACSAGASVSSAGLVAPIPALAMITGFTLPWFWLSLWVFSVCMVGISIAVILRNQLIIRDRLPFAFGLAAAETLREMYARGSEAAARLGMLVSFGALASVVKLVADGLSLKALAPPVTVRGFSLGSWTVALNPTLLMVGIGGLIGFRACLSLLLGAGLGYLLLAPPLVQSGHIPLTTHEMLHVAPADLELLTTPDANPRFNPARHRLEWRGVMTRVEHDSLISLSRDPRYAEAVDKLYVRSQMGVGAAERLQLAERLGVTTTRDVQISTPLAAYPGGFVMPVAWEDLIHRDRDRGRLVAVGNVTDEARDDILAAVAGFEDRYGASDATRSLRDAVLRLHERATGRYLPDDLPELPAEVGAMLTYDRLSHTLVLAGIPDADQRAQLRTLSADPDFQTTIAGLLAGASLAPVAPSFGDLNQWLLWPGVMLMVVASFTSFGFSIRDLVRSRRERRGGSSGGLATVGTATIAGDPSAGEVGMRWFMLSVSLALVLSVILQSTLFQIALGVAVLAVLISFLLAVVAARVSGETAITPVGAMGKVSQLVFGALAPGNVAANLMTANVTGGAASQCADLLHDLKCGWLLGAQSRWQMVAQVFGALSGAIAGSAIYLVMIPSPAEQLMTTEWPAPAVAAWKAVAELFQIGFAALPRGAVIAMICALVAGIVLPLLEQVVPRRLNLLVPSASSVGLALIIPASYSVNMFLGGLLALIVTRVARTWSQRFLVTACAGIVAGESITGVAEAIGSVLKEYL
ncbi:MAG: OPT/YSL family transporter [Candidatus Krumholzibacteriia bacterium]